MIQKDVIILGAGISGLFCAIAAGRRGKSTVVLDHAGKPLRKLLISGGGKCNVTNKTVTEQHYYCQTPKFTRSALAGFSSADAQELLQNANIPLEEREEGQLFCRRASTDIYDYLLGCAREARCDIALRQQVCSVERTSAGTAEETLFIVKTATDIFAAPVLVVATGSPAWPQVGATDLGMQIARQFGHTLVPLRPALSGFVLAHHSHLLGLAGISHRVSITHAGAQAGKPSAPKGKIKPQTVAHNLSLLFTHTGISGPAALQASLYWQPGDTLLCNFLPESGESTTGASRAEALLLHKDSGKLLVKNLFKPFFAHRLLEALLPEPIREKKVAEVSKAERGLVMERLESFSLEPVKTEGYRKAEVCAGGVNTSEVSSKDMQSRLCAGLYFCGEVLDVTGRLGGYNIHWALASGLAAGRHV